MRNFTKREWGAGEPITAFKLNNLEDQMEADAIMVENVVKIQDNQPSHEDNKIWVDTADETPIQIPTYNEFINLKNNIAAEYDNTKTYNVGDYCLHDNILYHCITTIDNAESWTASHWEEVSIDEEIKNIVNNKVNTTDFNALQEDFSDYQSAFDNLQTDFNSLQGDFSDSQEAFTSLQENFTSLQEDFSDSQETFNDLQTDFNSLQEEASKNAQVLNIYEILVNNGIYTISKDILESGQWTWSNKTATPSRIRSKFLIPVKKGMVVNYKSSNYDVYFGVLETPTSGTYLQNNGWICKEEGTYGINFNGYMTFIVRNKTDTNAEIEPTDWDGTVVIKNAYDNTSNFIQNLEYKWEHHGIKELNLHFMSGLFFSCASNSIITQDLNNNIYGNGMIVSYFCPLPKDGLFINQITTLNTGRQAFRLCFTKLNSNGDMVNATEYEKYLGTDAVGGYDGYYPYAENTYFTIIFDKSKYDVILEVLHFITGHINENGGRLPNLQPATIAGRRTAGTNYSKADTYLDIWNHYGWVSEVPASANVSVEERFYFNGLFGQLGNYCSILPLNAINSITVAPPYSMAVRIYKINNDNREAELIEEAFGCVQYTDDFNRAHRNYSGISYYDFSKLNYEGIVLIGITTSRDIYSTNGTITSRKNTMGILNKYEEVYNSVFVEWKPGIEVTYESGIPAIVAKNIRTIRNTPSFIAEQITTAGDAGYGNWNQEKKIGYDGIPLGICSGWWYCGSNMQNGPHMHVNPKSYITASKNLHSRVYVPTHPSLSYKSTNNLYGTVCSSTASTICGFQVGSETFSYCSELIDNFEYRDVNGIESLKPGYLFASGTFVPEEEAERSSYGHVVYITEKVSINGEVWCVNAFEGAQPWTRYRTFMNYSAYDGYSCSTIHKNNYNDINIFTYYSWESYINGRLYMKLARPDPSLLHTFRDAYGPYDITDYPVSNIMCDRGTDSIYCVGEYMALTITDNTTSFDLYRNGTLAGTVDLNNYPVTNYTDEKVYNVTNMITNVVASENKNGYYEIKVGENVKESFYVPPERHLFVKVPPPSESNNPVEIYFDDDESEVDGSGNEIFYDKTVAVMIEYWSQNDPISRPVYDWQHINNGLAQSGDYTGYRYYYGVYYPRFCDGITRGPLCMAILRRTPYGTYQVKKFNYQSANYRLRQRAGLMLSYEDG